MKIRLANKTRRQVEQLTGWKEATRRAVTGETVEKLHLLQYFEFDDGPTFMLELNANTARYAGSDPMCNMPVMSQCQ